MLSVSDFIVFFMLLCVYPDRVLSGRPVLRLNRYRSEREPYENNPLFVARENESCWFIHFKLLSRMYLYRQTLV